MEAADYQSVSGAAKVRHGVYQKTGGDIIPSQGRSGTVHFKSDFTDVDGCI